MRLPRILRREPARYFAESSAHALALGEHVTNYRFAMYVGPASQTVPVMSVHGLEPGETNIQLSFAAHVGGRDGNALDAFYAMKQEFTFAIEVQDGVRNPVMKFTGTGTIDEIQFGELDAGANKVFLQFATLHTSNLTYRHIGSAV